MGNSDDLKLLFASRYPLVIAEVTDETRFLEIVSSAAAELTLPVWVWTATRGLARTQNDAQYGTKEPGKALEFARDLKDPAVFVFADAGSALEDPLLLRTVKEFAQSNSSGQTLVITAARPVVPPEIKDLAVLWRLIPPTAVELKAMVMRTLNDLKIKQVPVTLNDEGIDELVSSLKGFSMAEAERLVRRAAARDGAIADDDIVFVRDQKAQMLNHSVPLQVMNVEIALDAVGGLDGLKEWLRLRGRAFEPAAKKFGLEPPRGVLITGVPGCGKSLIAKALARTWSLPLAALDVAALYGPYVGESEERLRDALSTTEAMAPIVLWIDEMEKAFATSGKGDGGVSQRILGSFLRWMQERAEGIFVIATSNDVQALPPELLRKGRFDEIFFVDLPGTQERAQIFGIQLAKRSRDPKDFDLDALAAASEAFSGAEIEAAIVAAMYRSYADASALDTQSILNELKATVPLSRTRAEDVGALRTWASTHAVSAGGPSAR
ncbi:MAG: AAA family ATPase [Actinomycetota bacterium]|nr:AAA family ATPase [Actinomycetota bacterium]